MSRQTGADTGLAMLAVATALVVAVAVGWGLSLLARPAGFAQQMATIERQADQTDGLLGKITGQAGYPTGAICDTSPDAAIAQLSKSIGGAAGVTLASFSGAPQAPDEAHGGLQPIAVSIQASGQYAALVGLLKTLAQSQPMLFVDTLNLKSNAGAVTLKLSGRMFCSAVHL